MPAHSMDALFRSLNKGELAPVYYLHGREDVLKDEAVKAAPRVGSFHVVPAGRLAATRRQKLGRLIVLERRDRWRRRRREIERGGEVA